MRRALLARRGDERGRRTPRMPAAPHLASQRPAEGEEILPPENFAMVWRGVYRSGFPTKKNLAFLQQLGLRDEELIVGQRRVRALAA